MDQGIREVGRWCTDHVVEGVVGSVVEAAAVDPRPCLASPAFRPLTSWTLIQSLSGDDMIGLVAVKIPIKKLLVF